MSQRLKVILELMLSYHMKQFNKQYYEGENIFIRHIDGDPLNHVSDNLCYISFEDTVIHIDEWEVDWTYYLADRYQESFREECRKYNKEIEEKMN